jgi:hypothetical protein
MNELQPFLAYDGLSSLSLQLVVESDCVPEIVVFPPCGIVFLESPDEIAREKAASVFNLLLRDIHDFLRDLTGPIEPTGPDVA